MKETAQELTKVPGCRKNEKDIEEVLQNLVAEIKESVEPFQDMYGELHPWGPDGWDVGYAAAGLALWLTTEGAEEPVWGRYYSRKNTVEEVYTVCERVILARVIQVEDAQFKEGGEFYGFYEEN